MEKNGCDMGTLFSELEALRIAIDMEARGRDFYKKAYDQAESKEHKDLFMQLMNDETAHHDQFSRLYNKVKASQQTGDDYLFDQETSRYLTVLAEPYIFPKDKQLSEFKTIADILRAALQDEKDAILFYDALAQCAKFEEARKVFNILKSEEQAHAIKLRRMLDSCT